MPWVVTPSEVRAKLREAHRNRGARSQEGAPRWRLEGLLECVRCIPREQGRLLHAKEQYTQMSPGVLRCGCPS